MAPPPLSATIALPSQASPRPKQPTPPPPPVPTSICSSIELGASPLPRLVVAVVGEAVVITAGAVVGEVVGGSGALVVPLGGPEVGGAVVG